jgi:hypothetical protein
MHKVIPYILIKDPASELRMPELKIPCGDNPLMLCEESAKAPPINLVREVEDMPAVTDTLVAKVIQLSINY